MRTWSERTCVLLCIFAMTSMIWSCSQLSLLEGLSCRKCNSVSCWPSQLRDQHVTHLLSQQRWTHRELLAGKGLMGGGECGWDDTRHCLPLPVIQIFIRCHIFLTCFMIPSVVPQTAVCGGKWWHWRGVVMKSVYYPGRRSSKSQGRSQSRLWGEC